VSSVNCEVLSVERGDSIVHNFRKFFLRNALSQLISSCQYILSSWDMGGVEV
jgi:hypothetical protein